MAHQNLDCIYSLPAAADLRTHQHKLIVVNSSGLVALCGVGAHPHGKLDNVPNTSEMARIILFYPVLKLKAGTGGVTLGAAFCSDAAGAAIAGSSGNQKVGIALETAAAGVYFTALMLPGGLLGAV